MFLSDVAMMNNPVDNLLFVVFIQSKVDLVSKGTVRFIIGCIHVFIAHQKS